MLKNNVEGWMIAYPTFYIYNTHQGCLNNILYLFKMQYICNWVDI